MQATIASPEDRVRPRSREEGPFSLELAFAEERERRALAQKLHEDLCQILAVVNFKVTALQERVPGGETLRELEVIESLVDFSSRAARSLAFQLSPPVLHTAGLAAALAWLGEDMERLHGLKVRVYDDGAPKPLGMLARATLFRAARELLLNVARHAQAGVAELSTMRFGDCVALSVTDDGCGFDCEARAISNDAAGHYGLLWMRERIALIGGEIHVDSGAGRGTHVTLRVMLDDRAAPQDVA